MTPHIRIGKVTMAALVLLGLGLMAAPAASESWWAQPMVVHEWGVNTFDWSGQGGHDPELPGFVYTDQKPGNALGQPEQRIRDLPPDSGIRTKPILYFYPYFGWTQPGVDIETRFAFGHAVAWYPQASVYRTPEQVEHAQPIDWNAWRQRVNRMDPKHRLTEPVPEDERFELVWNGLQLSESVPDGMNLVGEDLAEDHWWHIARDVPGAAYVSNGEEVERFLFYEGKTRERPAVAVVAGHDWFQGSGPSYVVNVSDETIYDVLVIYRDPQGRRWVGYQDELPPVPAKQPGDAAAARPMGLTIPEFAEMADDRWITTDDRFTALTRDRLENAMLDGQTVPPLQGVMMRDPADPQSATTTHQLFPREAQGLLQIWHDDFFEADGLTILYRESPAYLDRAMPLNIYTSMYNYVELSRCGWVLNQNVGIDSSHEVMTAVYTLLFYQAQDSDEWRERVAQARSLCNTNRLMALGCITYFERQLGKAARVEGVDRFDALRRELEEPVAD